MGKQYIKTSFMMREMIRHGWLFEHVVASVVSVSDYHKSVTFWLISESEHSECTLQ